MTTKAAQAVTETTKATAKVITTKASASGESLRSSEAVDVDKIKETTAKAAAAGWGALSSLVHSGVTMVASLAGVDPTWCACLYGFLVCCWAVMFRFSLLCLAGEDETAGGGHRGDVYPGATKNKFQAFGSDAYFAEEKNGDADDESRGNGGGHTGDVYPGAQKNRFESFGSDAYFAKDKEDKVPPRAKSTGLGGSATQKASACKRSNSLTHVSSVSAAGMAANGGDDWDWMDDDDKPKARTTVKSRATGGTKARGAAGKKKKTLVVAAADLSGGEDDDDDFAPSQSAKAAWGDDDDLGFGNLGLEDDEPKKPAKKAVVKKAVAKKAAPKKAEPAVLEAPEPVISAEDKPKVSGASDGWDDNWWDDDEPAVKVTSIKSRRR